MYISHTYIVVMSHIMYRFNRGWNSKLTLAPKVEELAKQIVSLAIEMELQKVRSSRSLWLGVQICIVLLFSNVFQPCKRDQKGWWVEMTSIFLEWLKTSNQVACLFKWEEAAILYSNYSTTRICVLNLKTYRENMEKMPPMTWGTWERLLKQLRCGNAATGRKNCNELGKHFSRWKKRNWLNWKNIHSEWVKHMSSDGNWRRVFESCLILFNSPCSFGKS